MEKFSHETNGYNRSEVNNFISNVIKETEGIIIRVKEQNTEITRLKKELEHYKNLTNMNSTIQNSEINNINELESVQAESKKIIIEAKNNASRIVNEALIKAEKIENNSQLIQKNIKNLKRNMNLILEQQKNIIEEIEILEIEES